MRNMTGAGNTQMKNKFAVVFIAVTSFLTVVGCSSFNPFADRGKGSNARTENKTLTDKVVDTAVGEQKIGVPECDEVMDMLAAEANNPDDNFVTKAVKGTFLNKIKESIKKSVDEKKGDTKELAKSCREFKSQLEKYKAEEEQKKK